MSNKHFVYLNELSPTSGWPEVVPGGHYQGNKHNWPLYSRGPKETAVPLDRQQAIRIVQEARDSGYSCHSEPPITVTY